MQIKFSLEVGINLNLYGLAWEIENAKANVIIFEGMEEHSSRYARFADDLNKAGYNTYCLDCFGQGLNVKEDLSNRGIWPKDGFEKQLKEFDKLVDFLKNKNNLPTYIFAHSMGSYFGQRYIEDYPGKVMKIVLCGACGKNPALPGGIVVSKLVCNKKSYYKPAKLLNNLMFGSFNKGIKNPGSKYDWLSYYQPNIDKYLEDPLCGFGPTNGFCYEFINFMRPIYKKKNLSNINKDTKIFIITGDRDPVTNFGKYTNQLLKIFSSQHIKTVNTKIYENMRHEILNESDEKREIVVKDIIDFLK